VMELEFRDFQLAEQMLSIPKSAPQFHSSREHTRQRYQEREHSRRSPWR
jgi:hypothetical protein